MNLEGKLFIRENLFDDETARDYVIQKVLTDIDSDSEFEIKNQELLRQEYNPFELMQKLASLGYDVMLGYDNEEIIGHIAYQQHQEEDKISWHMFRIFIPEEKRGRGYFIPLFKEVIKKARTYKISRLKMGNEKTKNPYMVVLINALKRREKKLGIKIDEENHLLTL